MGASPAAAPAEVETLLAEPLADGLSRGDALRFGALLHDTGKPATRKEGGGYVTFIGHDREGAEVIGRLCERLRTSRRLSRHLQALARHHLRLGFMVPERPLPPRRVHEYLRATEPVEVDVTLLTIADRLAARGSGPIASEEMVEAHLELAREMIAAALDWRRDGPPAALLPETSWRTRSGSSRDPGWASSWPSSRRPSTRARSRAATEAVEHARRLARR